jgi:hypothetical protein
MRIASKNTKRGRVRQGGGMQNGDAFRSSSSIFPEGIIHNYK